MPKQYKVYRDGHVHVLAAPCVTCIFGPDRPVDTERVRGMLASCVNENRIIPCHEWMDTKTPVVCRGLYNTGQVGVLQIAERLGVVQFDDIGDGPGFENWKEEQ
jgi:hypothetical protein